MSTYAERLEAAGEAGRAHGEAAASWYFDGNTPNDTYRLVLEGIREGDPEVLDTFPCNPLSGEWAGDPTPSSVLEDLEAGNVDEDEAAELLDAYEDAFSRAVHDSIELEAMRMLGTNSPAVLEILEVAA